MLPVKIVAVGDELLEGRTADTNSRLIQRALGGHAVRVDLVQVVPDHLDAIIAALDRTGESDLVFVTGGLGSTPDDISRDAVARWAAVDLAEDARVMAMLQDRWRRRGIATAPGAVRQAQVPAGLKAVANPVGSAPGLVGRLQGRWLAMLPGVPAELQGLLPLMVAELAAAGVLPAAQQTLLWRTAQVAELSLVRQCEPVKSLHPDLRWSWWLTDWGVDIRVAGPHSDSAALAEVSDSLDGILGPIVFGRTEASLPLVVQNLMLARGCSLAVAESCTGGLIGGHLTANAGSSGFFRGGFLTYTNEAKQDLLGVSERDLADHGAVSEPVVRAMAAGARQRLQADYALAVSGISGPDGGSEEKPVGTTWIGLACADGTWARRYRFPADRDRNRLLAVAAAIDSLRRLLVFGPGQGPWHGSDTWAAGR